MATSPATRETALLMAEAMPDRLSSTAPRMAEVRGATVIVRPRPKTRTPASACPTKSKGSSIASSIRKPAAATIGPAAMNHRLPKRPAREPNHVESAMFSTVTGSRTSPAWVAPRPAPCCR